jgi:hypothetical protein
MGTPRCAMKKAAVPSILVVVVLLALWSDSGGPEQPAKFELVINLKTAKQSA